MTRHHFSHIALPPAHIDLRFFLRKLGYRGGLKAIEKSFGLVRAPEINGMDGYDAVMFWRAYHWGDQSALERLIQYTKKYIKYPTSQKGHNDAFSVVTGGRAPCFCDLSLGETAAPACGRMRRGQGMPPQISHKKHQPGRLGTKEKTSFAQTNVEWKRFSLVTPEDHEV
ncbi:MAG: ribonuclease H-like domain-containing protein [Desulfobacterales bacterium]|nr:ribonuclease H-like domain-containing protein [Desulfobacterales bacterium]